jgi:hypothetical protein
VSERSSVVQAHLHGVRVHSFVVQVHLHGLHVRSHVVEVDVESVSERFVRRSRALR